MRKKRVHKYGIYFFLLRIYVNAKKEAEGEETEKEEEEMFEVKFKW